MAWTGNRTKTFSALNPAAALENSSQAESSCTRADGAKLIEGHRVTMDPRTIYNYMLSLKNKSKTKDLLHTKTYGPRGTICAR